MAFYGELFRKKDEEDIWEELKRMLRNPPTEEEIALKKQQEQAKIDEAISRMFSDEPEPAKEPYLTPEELLSPQDAERYRQKQMVQNNLNASGGEPTGFAAPITQNKQGGLIGNTKVQQMFNKPTNWVNQNNNLVQGLGNLQEFKKNPSNQGKEFKCPKENIESSLNKYAISGNPLNNTTLSKIEKSNSQQDISKNKELNFGEKVLDALIQNKNVTGSLFPVASGMYTDSRTDFSRARTDKNATILNDMKTLDQKTKRALEKYGVNSNERGVYYNEKSETSKKFGKSEELKQAIDNSLAKGKNRKFNGEDLNFSAKPLDIFLNKDKFDRYSSIQHAKLIDTYVDKNGQKHGRFIDNYDFNKRPDLLKNLPNNHGYSLQEKGALENFFTVVDVILEDEEEKERLLNKLINKFRQ